MELEKAKRLLQLEQELDEAQLVLIDDDSTAYTCGVCGTNESWGMEYDEALKELLELEEDHEDIRGLYVSFNPCMAHDDGDSFELPLIDILNGVYDISKIK